MKPKKSLYRIIGVFRYVIDFYPSVWLGFWRCVRCCLAYFGYECLKSIFLLLFIVDFIETLGRFLL